MMNLYKIIINHKVREGTQSACPQPKSVIS